MLRLIKKCFFTAVTCFNSNTLKYISVSNKECKIRPVLININSDQSSFYSYSNLVNKCSGSCNNINDLYAKWCVPDVIKNINIKVFNLMSRTNEMKHVPWQGTCTWKCRLDAIVCNDKQCWNNDKCRCECK